MTSRIYYKLRAATLIVIVLGLAACSSDTDQPFRQAFGALTAQLGGGNGADIDARSQLTPAVVASVEQPFLLVELPVRQASATMTVFAAMDGVEDWRGADGTSLVLRNDILVGTRGLGADLFAADAGEARSAINDGHGTIRRTYRHLDGENREVVRTYTCTITRNDAREDVDLIARREPTEKRLETCQADGSDSHGFTNEYWVGLADRQIWQSRQWVSDTLKAVLIQHLVR